MQTEIELEMEIQRSLNDMFSLVNDKMMCDIKVAREEGMHQKSVEHRLKLSCESEAVLIGAYVPQEKFIYSCISLFVYL